MPEGAEPLLQFESTSPAPGARLGWLPLRTSPGGMS